MSQYTAKDIAIFMKSAKDKEKPTPFVFFTGAGCSKTANIPLAQKLVEEINKNYPIQLKSLTDEEKRDYGKCMAALDKDERRVLIQPYIRDAKINWAHIALATMLESGYIARVLTFNFDNVLARACGLLGLYPSTYDFTSADVNLHNLIQDPAIVHLHGQGYGFTQLNTEAETQEHAQKLSHFIASTLNTSPSLFIGYSGGADAFFPLLNEKFCGQHRLFWAGNSKEPKEHIEEFFKKNNSLTHYLGGTDADRFLIELAQELDCFPPKLFSNPYEHLIKELEPVIAFPAPDDTSLDSNLNNSSADLLSSVLSDLEKAKADHKSSKLEFEFMQGRYDRVVSRANDENLTDNDKKIIAWAYAKQGSELCEKAKLEKNVELFQQGFINYQAAVDIQPSLYKTLYNWGNALYDLASLTNSSDYYLQSIAQYEAALRVEPNFFEALCNCATVLAALATSKSDVAIYNKSFEKFEAAYKIKSDQYIVLYMWGFAQAELAYLISDIELYEQSFEKLSAAFKIKSDDHILFQVWGRALLRLSSLKKESKFQMAIDARDKLEKAELLNADDVYNLACVLSCLGELDMCREKLLHCEKTKNLPDKQHLLEDLDLGNVRELPWFNELLVRMN